jgi:chromate transporter
MWVGYLRSGAAGALATALAFILPSFALVLGVAVVYVRYEGLDVVQALFYGIAPGVMAIIAVAAVRLARLTNGRDPRLWVISAITGIVTAVTGAEIALLFIGAGLVMMVWEAPPRFRGSAVSNVMLVVPSAHALLTGVLPAEQLLVLAWFFFKAGALIFGSGLAIVPFLREGVVEQHHWLTEREFLDGVAMGLITPGPVVITATFVAIYLGVVVPGPWFVRHRASPRLQGFVKGATAAAAGAIGGATIVLTRGAVVDWATAGIAAAALAFVLAFRNREPVLVLLAALAGLALYPFTG